MPPMNMLMTGEVTSPCACMKALNSRTRELKMTATPRIMSILVATASCSGV
jgi:hypothetical protein